MTERTWVSVSPGEVLRDLRELHEMTQGALSRKSGISEKSIANMEAGRDPISQERAKTLSKVLGYLVPSADDPTSLNEQAVDAVRELDAANAKFPAFNSYHEGWAVLYEEVAELWEVVKLNPKKIQVESSVSRDRTRLLQNREHRKMLRSEAVQVAAMALKFMQLIDGREGDEERQAERRADSNQFQPMKSD